MTVVRFALATGFLVAAVMLARPASAVSRHYDHLLPRLGACKADRSPRAAHAIRNRAVVCLVNRARDRHGIARLQTSSHLRQGARRKVNDIVRCRSASHDPCREGAATSYGRAGYGPDAAENLGFGYRTPREVVSGWLHSSGHRAFMLEARHWRDGWNGQGHAHIAVWSRRYQGRITWALAFGRSANPGPVGGPHFDDVGG